MLTKLRLGRTPNENRSRADAYIDSQLPKGVGKHGKHFYLAALAQIYLFAAIVRAVSAPDWLTTASITAREYVLVSMMLRIHEIWHKSSTIFNIVCSVLQLVFLVAATVSFHFQVTDVPKGDWNQSLFAVVSACVCSCLVVTKSIRDFIVTKGENDDIGRSRRRVIQANLIAVWVIVVGGVGFHFIENMPMMESYNFAIVTVLTIGYGNTVPRSTAGRIFLFFYFLLGATCIGYFISSVEHLIIEKAKDSIVRIHILRCIREAERGYKSRPERNRLSELKKRFMLALFPDTMDQETLAAEVDEFEMKKKLRKRRPGFLSSISQFNMRRRKIEPPAVGSDSELGQVVPGDVSSSGMELSAVQQLLEQMERDPSDSSATTAASDSDSSSTREHCSVTEAMERDEAFQAMIEQRRFWRMIIVSVSWWIISSVVFKSLEPSWTYMDAFYFTFCTITTIGYGDLFPSRPASWEFWNIFVFLGVAGAAHAVGLITERFTTRFARSAAKVQLRIEKRRAKQSADVPDSAGDGDAGQWKGLSKFLSKRSASFPALTTLVTENASALSAPTAGASADIADAVIASDLSRKVSKQDGELDRNDDDVKADDDSSDDASRTMQDLYEQVYDVMKSETS